VIRIDAVVLTVAVLIGMTAYGCAGDIAKDAPASQVPAAVNCTDAPQLRQRALDDRRLSGQSSSDQDKINVGNRARFLASLAIVAELKCKVTLAAADDALQPALDAARKAQETPSFYERTVLWGEADFMATQVVAMLVQQLPAPSVK
jgi:hypothetical protein